MKKYNFNAGPSVLPDVVLEAAAKAIIDFNGTGLSLLSISHRTPEFESVLAEAQSLMRELLGIPDNYKIYFVGGGASTQFFHIPANFLGRKAGYINTGVWTKKAIKEAKFYGDVEIVASSEDKNFSYIPKGFEIPADLDYLYICANNTIYGTQLHADFDSPVPMIADMSSDILSRPVDVSKYSCIYGGAQKNLAQSGLSFVIVKESALGNVERAIPSILDYRVHIANGSMFNTPPTLPIYTALCNMRWVKEQGGVAEMERRALQRADMLYGEIDSNPMFRATVNGEDRSYMNIDFVMAPGYEELEKSFVEYAASRGVVAITGHRSVGGFRASCYNAMPLEGVAELVGCMRDFAKK